MADQYPTAAKRGTVIAFMGLGSVAMLLIGIDYSPPAKETGFVLVTVGFIMMGFVAGALFGRYVNRNRGKVRGLRPSTTAGQLGATLISLGSLLGIYTTAAFVTDTGYLTLPAALASAICGLMSTIRPPSGEETPS